MHEPISHDRQCLCRFSTPKHTPEQIDISSNPVNFHFNEVTAELMSNKQLLFMRETRVSCFREVSDIVMHIPHSNARIVLPFYFTSHVRSDLVPEHGSRTSVTVSEFDLL